MFCFVCKCFNAKGILLYSQVYSKSPPSGNQVDGLPLGFELWNAVILKIGGPKCIRTLATLFERIENIWCTISPIACAPKGFYLYELSYSRNNSIRSYIGIICPRKFRFRKIFKNLEKLFKKVGKIEIVAFLFIN